jgi:hypothetical protein
MENRFELIEDELPLPSVGNPTLINARVLMWEELDNKLLSTNITLSAHVF